MMTILVLQATETTSVWSPGLIWIAGAFLLGGLLTWFFIRPKPAATVGPDQDRDRLAAAKWEKDYQGVKHQLNEARRVEKELRASLQRAKAEKQSRRHRTETAEANRAIGSAIIPENTNQPDGEPDPMRPYHAAKPELSYTAAGYDELFESDNFQVIEGIGPRVNALLLGAGYPHWEALATAEVDDLLRILQEAGNRFTLSDPSGWPAQARLAAAGDWEALVEYQKSGGADGTGSSDSKFEKLAARQLGFSSANPHDLKVVEGIGTKVEKVLKSAGISDWGELAATAPEELSRILSEAGDRYRLSDPGDWPEQARYASAGQWRELNSMQQALKEARK